MTERPEQSAGSTRRSTLAFLGEHFLLAMALFLAIPPLTSHEGHPYRLDFAMLIVIFAAVLGSRWFARLRRESWAGAILKAFMFAVFALVNYQAR